MRVLKVYWKEQFSEDRAERGVFLMLFALLLFTAIAFLALVIDQSKESLALENIQRAADAASLAAVRQLDSTKVGWTDARRAAVVALKSNPIHGARQGLQTLLLNENGPTGPWPDPSSQHIRTTGSGGGITLKVERGIIWFDTSLRQGLGDYVFRSLEEDAPGFLTNGKLRGLVDSYLVANAVKTTVRLDSLPAYLGAIIGHGSFDNLERSSIAVSNSELEVEVAPFAIPYCQLLLDTDVHTTSGNHISERYDPSEQQKRELVFTEADPQRNLLNWDGIERATLYDTVIKRREGITRFESFIRRPYVEYDQSKPTVCHDSLVGGKFTSCKHPTIYGTIGKPSEYPNQITTPDELEQLFRKAMQPGKSNRILAKLGGYFAPLQEPVDSATTDSKVTRALDDFITSGDLTFAQAFLPITTADVSLGHFPFIRTIRPKDNRQDPELRPFVYSIDGKSHDILYDLRLGWPTQHAVRERQEQKWIRLILDADLGTPTRAPASWTNPMCHSEGGKIVANAPQQQIRRVRVMVVAPGNPKYDYCDFSAIFDGEQQRAVPPIEESLPTIVGTVEVDIFDHHLGAFENNAQFVRERNSAPMPNLPFLNPETFRKTITPHYPSAGPYPRIVDRHPAELDIKTDQYFERVESRIRGYKERYEYCFGPPSTGLLGESIPYNSKCPGDPSEIAKAPEEIQSASDIFPVEYYECFKLENLFSKLWRADRKLWRCLKGRDCDDSSRGKSKTFNDLFNTLNNLRSGIDNIAARPFSHCLNQFKVGKYDPKLAESYDNLRPLRAGHGCGGVRGKIVVDATQRKVWPTGSSHSEASPALIKVSEAT